MIVGNETEDARNYLIGLFKPEYKVYIQMRLAGDFACELKKQLEQAQADNVKLREGLLEAADVLEVCDETLCSNAGCTPSGDHEKFRALAQIKEHKDE